MGLVAVLRDGVALVVVLAITSIRNSIINRGFRMLIKDDETDSLSQGWKAARNWVDGNFSISACVHKC